MEIKRLLEEKRIPMSALADHLKPYGVKPQIINHWFAGRSHSYMKHISVIAQFMGVDEESLIKGEDGAIPVQDPDGLIISKIIDMIQKKEKRKPLLLII
ncbi:MAG: helix-turn-helix domain-containing protein [Clostridiales bacterium]|nr:helix-turn-helix domain-containing protein [Clostridiales bacterium]